MFLIQICYIPCILVIKKQLNNSSAYKFMYFIGIVDLLTLPLNAILTGYFGYIGAVYCSFPNLMYIIGCFGLSKFYFKYYFLFIKNVIKF